MIHFNIENIMILKKNDENDMPHVYMSMFVIYRISTDKRTNTERMTKIIKNEIKIRELSLE